MFIEAAETSNERSGSKKVKKFLSKVVSGGRKQDDSSDDEAPPESASGVGDAEGELDGHLFSVGVAFAQVQPLPHVVHVLRYRSQPTFQTCMEHCGCREQPAAQLMVSLLRYRHVHSNVVMQSLLTCSCWALHCL